MGADDATDGDRRRMVEQQLRGRGIHDERVLGVMGSIPRERFIGEGRERRRAYADEAVPIDAGQTISQPWVVARMTELLAPQLGERILELGTGSRYQAAVLAALGADVTSLERHAVLASKARDRIDRLELPGTVTIRTTDGSLGDPAGGPWDGIIVTAAAPAVPEPLRGQLAIGARLVIPVGGRWDQHLLVIERRGPAEWTESSGGAVVFVPLVGEQGYAEPEGRGRA